MLQYWSVISWGNMVFMWGYNGVAVGGSSFPDKFPKMVFVAIDP